MNSRLKNMVRKIPVLYPCWHKLRLAINAKREKNKKEAYRRYSKHILREIFEVVIEKEIKCVCIEGTLLGLIREGQLIPWDDDLDFAIIDDPSFSWDEFEKSMSKKGFWKFRMFEEGGKIVSQSYKKKGVLCDFGVWPDIKDEIEIVYGCYEIPGNIYVSGNIGKYRVWNRKVPGIKGITQKKIDEISVLIPKNSEEILAAIYGKNWRVPDPDFAIKSDEYEREYKATYFKKPFGKR